MVTKRRFRNIIESCCKTSSGDVAFHKIHLEEKSMLLRNALLLVCSPIVPFTLAQQSVPPPQVAVSKPAAMTNADIIDLSSLGISDDVVVQKITNAHQVAFDTSIDGLKQLKAAKVSDVVMKAMLAQQNTIAQASPDAAISTFHSIDGKMRIYVTDHPMNEVIGMIRGSSASGFHADATSAHGGSVSTVGGYEHGQAGDDPRTVEIQADLQKSCPPYVMVSNNPARADYVLIFRREGGKRTGFAAMGGLAGLAIASGAKVDGASLFLPNGDMVFATRENTVAKAVKASCTQIPSPAPVQPTP